MGNRINLTLSALLLFLTLILVGCSSESEDTATSNQSLVNGWAFDFMRSIPSTANYCAFGDISSEKESLDADHDEFEELLGEAARIAHIDFWAIETFATADGMLLCKGNFDLDFMWKRLELRGFQKGKQQNYETWYLELEGTERNHESFIVFAEDMIIVGSRKSIQDSISAISRSTDSIYDDPEFKEIITLLPDGKYIEFKRNIVERDIEYDGIEKMAVSVDYNEYNTLSTAIYEFTDEESATKAKSEMEPEMQYEKDSNTWLKDFSLMQENNRLIFTLKFW